MDIPDWLAWITLAVVIHQALALVPVVRRMRGPEPAMRAKARLDLLETVGCLLLVGGLPLSLVLTEAWLWPMPVGFALMAAVHGVKGVRLLRARRPSRRDVEGPRPTARCSR